MRRNAARKMGNVRPSRATRTATKPAPARFAAIDGLRGVACLAVVAHHAYYSAGRYTWPLGLPKLLSYGYLGVEIFFALSGFCLAYPLLARDSNDWVLYAKRRARRILPAYWAVLVLLLGASLIIDRLRIEPFFTEGVLIVPSLRQFFYVATLIAVWFNPVFWTLTVEARWYFVLPFCTAITRRVGAAALFIASVAISAAYALVEPFLSGRLQLVLGPLPLFLPLFASGIGAAVLLRRCGEELNRTAVYAIRFAIVSSLILIACFTPAHPDSVFRYSRIVPGGLLAAALLAAALWDPLVRRALSGKLVTFIGLVSYSLYLIHLPLIQFAYAITQPWHLNERTQFLIYECVIVPLTVCVAYLFYAAFERPFLQLAPSRRTAVAQFTTDSTSHLRIDTPAHSE